MSSTQAEAEDSGPTEIVVIDHEGKADVHHYTSLVEIDGWLSACVINHGGETFLSIHKSAQLDDDHPDCEPIRRVLVSGSWVQTSYCLDDDEDTVGGLAVEIIYEMTEASAA